MAAIIIQTQEIVTLLGPSAVSGSVLTESFRLGPHLVAADGGAVVALNHGLMPRAVIGDFDSITDGELVEIPPERLHRIEEQDSTDFDKALRHIAAPLILAVGFTGQRLDHELAVYNALVRNPQVRAIVVGEDDICFHAPTEIWLDLPVGTRLSLFPMAAVECVSDGLRWPTTGMQLAPWGKISTSNATVSRRVRLAPGGPGVLVILPRAHIGAAIRALVG